MARIGPMMVVLALIFAACGSDAGEPIATVATVPPVTADTTQTPTTEPAEPEPPPQEATVSYLMRLQSAGPFLAPVHRRLAPGQPYDVSEGLDMVLKGESFTEAGIGFGTEIPRDTELLGVTVDDGVATVDVSREFDDGAGTFTMRARLAQLVFTATQFDEVHAVRLAIDGDPVDVFSSEGLDISDPLTRDAFWDLCPEVMIESPAAGETVSAGFTVTGMLAPPADKVTLDVVDWDGLIIYDMVWDEIPNEQEWTEFEYEVVLDPADVRRHPSGFYDLSLMMWQGQFGSGPGVEVPLYYRAPDVVLSDADGQTVTMQAGQTLKVFLPGNVTTGYTWMVHSMYMPVLELLHEPSYEPTSELAGSPGEFCYEFEAIQPGTVALEFHYERLFEDAPPLETVIVAVTVE